MSAAAIALLLASYVPEFSPRQEAAQLLETMTNEYQLPPELVVRYVAHESRGLAWVEHVNSTDVYVGLGQIRLRNYPECHDTFENEACAARRDLLRDWRVNLAETIRIFVTARSYCREVAHIHGARYWMQGPMGYDWLRHSRCGFKRGKPLRIPKEVLKVTQ